MELEVDHDWDIRRGSRAARRKISRGFREFLTSLEKRWVDKKKEMSAEIQLHEVVANLDLLNEINDEGLVIEDEIAHLKEMEKDCEAVASLATVPDWSVAGLDLPQVSEDSVVNNEAVDLSSDEGASSWVFFFVSCFIFLGYRRSFPFCFRYLFCFDRITTTFWNM